MVFVSNVLHRFSKEAGPSGCFCMPCGCGMQYAMSILAIRSRFIQTRRHNDFRPTMTRIALTVTNSSSLRSRFVQMTAVRRRTTQNCQSFFASGFGEWAQKIRVCTTVLLVNKKRLPGLDLRFVLVLLAWSVVVVVFGAEALSLSYTTSRSSIESILRCNRALASTASRNVWAVAVLATFIWVSVPMVKRYVCWKDG